MSWKVGVLMALSCYAAACDPQCLKDCLLDDGSGCLKLCGCEGEASLKVVETLDWVVKHANRAFALSAEVSCDEECSLQCWGSSSTSELVGCLELCGCSNLVVKYGLKSGDSNSEGEVSVSVDSLASRVADAANTSAEAARTKAASLANSVAQGAEDVRIAADNAAKALIADADQAEVATSYGLNAQQAAPAETAPNPFLNIPLGENPSTHTLNALRYPPRTVPVECEAQCVSLCDKLSQGADCYANCNQNFCLSETELDSSWALSLLAAVFAISVFSVYWAMKNLKQKGPGSLDVDGRQYYRLID